MTDVGGYNYTKPKRPIAAEFSGPGPCYALPRLTGVLLHDPRSVYNKAPAFSIAGRFKRPETARSPGPAAYVPRPRSHYSGRDIVRQYSLYSRVKDPDLDKTLPGPAAYSIHTPDASTRQAAPKYSFGLRPKGVRKDQTPAPNAYTIPMKQIGKQVPIISFQGRCKSASVHKTPGPGTYNTISDNVFKYKTPAWTMAPRTNLGTDHRTMPGPGSHSPEKVYAHLPNAPRFCFGMKHSPYEATLITSVED